MQPNDDRDSCDSGLDAAAMRCMPPESCEDGQLRLVDGESSIEGSGDFVNEGQVEICFLGIWGGVASSQQRWEYPDAAVVCNQLGYNPLGKELVLQYIYIYIYTLIFWFILNCRSSCINKHLH